MSSRHDNTLAIAQARGKFARGELTAARQTIEAALAPRFDPELALLAGRLAAATGDVARSRELLWRATTDATAASPAT